ncbi:MAG: glutamate ligase domain-containing protein, partial [Hyphomicrobiales bacterium]
AEVAVADNSQQALAAGASLDAVSAGLESLTPVAGRFNLQQLPDGVTVIDDTYNANPESMGAALAMLAATAPGPGGRRIAVLGDMLELGDHGQASHAALRDAVVAAKTDLVFACGPLMGHLWRQLPDSVKAVHETVAGDLMVPLAGQIRGGDVIMVKGSLGSAMGPLVTGLQVRFSDTAENL